jgi:hypothetical protein
VEEAQKIKRKADTYQTGQANVLQLVKKVGDEICKGMSIGGELKIDETNPDIYLQ